MRKLKYPPLLQFIVSASTSYGVSMLASKRVISIPFSTLLSITLALVGIILLIFAVGLFAKSKTTINPMEPDKASKLVTNGLYKYTRNPMYLGLLLCLIGFVIWLQNPVAILGVGFFVITMTIFQIIPEEEVMSAKFGKDYEDYKARVRRWL